MARIRRERGDAISIILEIMAAADGVALSTGKRTEL